MYSVVVLLASLSVCGIVCLHNRLCVCVFVLRVDLCVCVYYVGECLCVFMFV